MIVTESAIHLLDGKMEMPQAFGAFHLISFSLILLASILVCALFGRSSAKTERTILLTAWIIMVVFEIYKQLLYSIDIDGGVTWAYKWKIFPFQFCSSPLYVLPFAALCKNPRIRDMMRIFLATFSLFAGIAVMVVVGDVFSTYIGINIQTMLHHGLMIIIGVYLGERLFREGKLKLTPFLCACGLFAVFVIVALLLNLAAPLVTDQTFNMFFIGPHFPCTLILLEKVYRSSPYPLFLLIYIFGFAAAAFLVYLMQKYLRQLTGIIIRKKKEAP